MSGPKRMAMSTREKLCVNSYRRPLRQESKIGQTPWRHSESKGKKIVLIDLRLKK